MKKLPTIPEIRHANLRRIMSEKDITPAELARILNRSQGQVGQFAGPTRHKGIGDDNAREIEEALQLAPYTLDSPSHLLKPAATEIAASQSSREPDAEFNGYTSRKLPVVGVTAAGNAMETVDLYQPGVAEEWIDVPGPHTPGAFVLRLAGFSMQPKFWSDDLVVIEPALAWQVGDFVFAKRPADGDGTFKKLVEEEGRPFLFALNPEFKPRYLELTSDWVIVGKATWRIDKL